MSDWTHHRAVIAAKRRHHPDADLTEELRALRAARAEDYIKRLAGDLPALTVEQRSKLAVLLLSPSAAA